MNTVKTFSLLIVLTVLLVVAGYLISGGLQGAVFAFIFALMMNLLAFWFSDRLVLTMTHARGVTEKEDPQLHEVVQSVALKANIPKPRVYVIQNSSPNAFATGRSPQKTAVAATTGIMSLLSRDESEGVMAHEVAHVKNRDTLIMTVAATIAGAISMRAFWARWTPMLGGAGKGRGGASPIRGGAPGHGYPDALSCPDSATGHLPCQGIPGRCWRRQDKRQALIPGLIPGEAGDSRPGPPPNGKPGRLAPVYRQPGEGGGAGFPFLHPSPHPGAGVPFKGNGPLSPSLPRQY